MTDIHVNFNTVCYICGKFVTVPSRRKITEETAILYEEYFNLSVIRNVNWAPSIACLRCISGLNLWGRGKSKCMPFGVPMLWSNPVYHNPENCYLCVNKVCVGMNRYKSKLCEFQSIPSAQTPLPHSEKIPIPKKPSHQKLTFKSIDSESNILVGQMQYTFEASRHAVPSIHIDSKEDSENDEPWPQRLRVRHHKKLNSSIFEISTDDVPSIHVDSKEDSEDDELREQRVRIRQRKKLLGSILREALEANDINQKNIESQSTTVAEFEQCVKVEETEDNEIMPYYADMTDVECEQSVVKVEEIEVSETMIFNAKSEKFEKVEEMEVNGIMPFEFVELVYNRHK